VGLDHNIRATDGGPTHIVVLVHGIRTHAAWAEMVSDVIKKEMKASVLTIRFGFFDTLQFLSPFLTRKVPIKKVLRELRDLRTQNPNARISVIAHSFGTYALYKLLVERDVTLYRVILCGSIIPEHFRRADFHGQLGEDPILNDCGSHDIWPILARSATWGYGATGTFGFGTYGVIDRFNRFGHGDFFDLDFVKDYWVPFLERGEIRPTEWESTRNKPPYWHSLLSWMPLRWIAMVLILAIMFVILGSIVPFQVSFAWDARKIIKNYSSTVTLSGSEADCDAGKCIIAFHESAFVVAPRGQEATYEGRAKTSGRIISIQSEPPLDILNPNQFPGNPTYVQFRIRPSTDDRQVLQASGELIIQQKVTASGGKIGPHFPYYAESVVFMIDLRNLAFDLKSPIEIKIESQSTDGRLLPGYFSPKINYYENGKFMVITARGMPAESSIYAVWGNARQQ
jgi:Putative serine esterase (DUF676)